MNQARSCTLADKLTFEATVKARSYESPCCRLPVLYRTRASESLLVTSCHPAAGIHSERGAGHGLHRGVAVATNRRDETCPFKLIFTRFMLIIGLKLELLLYGEAQGALTSTPDHKPCSDCLRELLVEVATNVWHPNSTGRILRFTFAAAITVQLLHSLRKPMHCIIHILSPD
ncbi:uncharacterized protein V6R79_020519 [Siganus canaliculatus]